MFFRTIIPAIPIIRTLIKVSIIIYPVIWIIIFSSIISSPYAFEEQTSLKIDFLLFKKDLLISSLIHPVFWIALFKIFNVGMFRAILFSSIVLFSEHILFFALAHTITNKLELEIPFKMHIVINIILLFAIIIKSIKNKS